MKKIITLLLALVMCFACVSMSACKKEDDTTKIGVQASTTGHIYASCIKNCEAKAYTSPVLAVDDLLRGTVEYVIVDSETAKTIAAERQGVKVIDIPLSYDTYAVGVDKEQDALKQQINEVLVEKADVISEIVEKYSDFEANIADCVGFDISAMDAKAEASETSSNPEGQLVVATNAEFSPWEFMHNGKYYGIDIEIANIIATELGLELVIKHMGFDAVCISVGKNNVDCAIAALSITAERKDALNFTNGYFSDTSIYQVVMCKESNTKLDGATSAVDVLTVLSGLI